MNRRFLIGIFLISLACFPLAASDTTRPENNDADQTDAVQDTEAEGIIPEGGLTVSTQPITPIEPLQKGDPYDKGLKELALAQGLLQMGRTEAASDVSLQAYDDLMAVYVPRRIKKKRKKLLADRHQAAAVYVDASLAYIQRYVKREGGGSSAIEEGRARLGDLRDVSMNYPELNKKVTKALDDFAVKPSSPAVPAPLAANAAVSSPTVISPVVSSSSRAN